VDYLENRPRPRFRLSYLLIVIVLLLLGAKTVARFVIDYEWWKEMGQLSTWFAQLTYGVLPTILAALAAFLVLWLSHARALKAAGTRLRDYPVYSKLSTVVLLVLSVLLAAATIDSWTIVRFLGSFGAPSASGEWSDPVFGKPLAFYFFHLPFYRIVLHFAIGLFFLAGALHWIAARAWRLRASLPSWNQGEGISLDLRDLELHRILDSPVVRAALTIVFAGLAVSYYLDRYSLLFEQHGSLVGVDWTAENVTIPLLWITVFAALGAAVSVALGKFKPALIYIACVVLLAVVPGIVYSLYVRPSEITIQKPYIHRHIEATRSAYALSHHIKEIDFAAKIEAPIDLKRHQPLLDNVRLWDWRAFHDTVTQIQALRPYYVFNDSDVDRYQIGGQLRQLLLTPRELDVRQLPPDARARWINPHFVYTHGYGVVVAEAARITPDGLPVLLIQNAPPEIKTPDLKLTRPELYYGEVTHEPVFVRTKQPEFNYPSGAGNVETRYEGRGGFPISSPLLRLAAAVASGDWNIMLTSYLTGESRMMIHRRIRDRLTELAGFLEWDQDPYLVLTPEGRQVWIVDGYTTSQSHPYSQSVTFGAGDRLNYIRNSVKAVIDAYHGTTTLYVFDDADPILRAYRHLFPNLLKPASEMPPALRAHARYPETIFRIQAEIYRTYHMRDAEAFFNKEDVWDLARTQGGSNARAETVSPTYLVATLPGSDDAEFLLMTTFTPRNKDNLIGLLVARCDGEHLGEVVALTLSKQELIFGPMQIDAIINQDQNISKDLTLWSQVGSQVLRGQMMVLPVDNTLLYIEPIYIQASEARMPQLKKVAIAMGKRLVYTDTYEQAIAELAGQPAPQAETKSAAAAGPQPPAVSTGVLDQIRKHFQRYRELNSQGKFGDAGREIEAIQRLLKP